MKIELGWKVRDRITGFEGTVTGRCEYITGCNQVLISPRVKDDGAFKESYWIDEQRLERIGDSHVRLNNGASPGFDKAPPVR